MNKLFTLLLLLSPIAAAASDADPSGPLYYDEIVRLPADEPEATLDRYVEAGAILLNRRADLALLLIPYDMPDEETALRSVPDSRTESPLKRLPGADSPLRREMPRLSPQPTMDVAIPLTGANWVRQGTRLPSPYTGKGVVVGFCDTGFDTRHINFTDAEGNCRIRKVVRYVESQGLREEYTDPADIYDFHTDDPDQYHATHVAGILAGSYSPQGGITQPGSTITGIASDAEIVATMSELSEVGLLAGVEDIIAYAKSQGKPAVINLSVGNYTGPHDGTSLFCQYLDLCAEDAVICISSGNEGNDTNHQYLWQASPARPLKVRIAGADWVNLELKGQTDIYAADSTPFTITLRVADSTLDYENPVVSQTPPINLSETPFCVLSTYEEDADDPTVIYDPGFSAFFEGRVFVTGGIDPENGRYCANILYNCTTEAPFSDEKRWAKYRLDVIATPQAEVRLDAFADGIRSWLATAGDDPNRPGNEVSISDIATGRRVISVGMYCTRGDVTLLNGELYKGETEGAYSISLHSGYGILQDGRKLPLTSAPGRPIVSSWNGAYVAAHDTSDCSNYADAPDGSRHYWGPMSGTSMSSPYVAGVIATWIQAVPSLTWSDVQAILLQTNTYPNFDETPAPADNPRYGMGELQAYEGLKLALSNPSLSVGTINDESSIRMLLVGDEIHLLNPSGEGVTLLCHNMQGQLLCRLTPEPSGFTSIPVGQMRGDAATPCIISACLQDGSRQTLKIF